MKLWHEDFGKTKDGQSVTRWLMENGQGTRAAVLDYGATLQSLVFCASMTPILKKTLPMRN